MRIGLYGGTFDPVHCGHLLLVQAALEELSLDRLVVLPAAQSPFKPDQASLPASWRVRLLRLAFARMPQVSLDLREIDQGGISYTIDTVDSYRCEYPHASFFYLIGADHLASLPKWRSADRLKEEVTFAAMSRPGEGDFTFPEGFRGHLLRGMPVKISSSAIRSNLKAGKSVRWMVPPEVEEALLNNRLYL